MPGELSGMRQRPEDVEHRRDTEFGAHRTHVPHRWMKGAGERKTDTVFGNLGFELLRRDLDVDTDRLEEVEASRRRRSLPVAVLAHRGARAGGDERCHGRDVECVGAPTRGASDADDVDRGVGHVERLSRCDHRSLQPGELLDRFTLEPETDDEGSLLRIGGMAGEDLAQDGGALGCAQVGSGGETAEDAAPAAVFIETHASPSTQ